MKEQVSTERAARAERHTRLAPITALANVAQSGRAATRTAVFFLKLFPMWSSTFVDRLTKAPVKEKVRYPTRSGEVEVELYRPGGRGPHPGVVVCLGAVPFGVDHPQVPRLKEALARAGFVALLHWSPSMRDLRLDPGDIEDIAWAYEWLVEQPYVDPARSGLLGTCVGGSFALMAAAHPVIRERVAFVCAFAPYSSMWTLARDIASASLERGGTREPWRVDQLTRKVGVRTLTSGLETHEAELLREAFAEERSPVEGGAQSLSAAGHAVHTVLTSRDADEAQAALDRLPPAFQARLSRLSPMNYLDDIRAPLIVIGHDRNDQVIPVGESRTLRTALTGRPGVRYTEFGMFQHMDPTQSKLPPHRLAQELGRFYAYAYPMFRQAAA